MISLSTPGTEKEEAQSSQWVTFTFILAGIVAGIFLNSSAVEISGYMNLENPSVFGVLPASAALGLLGGVGGFFALARHTPATEFTDLVIRELRKVAWPTQEETVNNTMIVIGTTLFFSALLAVYDFAWTKLTGIFLYS